MNRKDFLRLSAIIAGGAMLPAKSLLARYNSFSDGNFKFLRNGVGIYTEKGGTVGWYLSGDTAVIVDAQFPDSAENFFTILSEKHKGNASLLINTHHHNDHTAGNMYLKDHVNDILAHKDCVKLQKENAKPGAEIVTANKTFTKEWNEKLPEDKMRVWHHCPAHTLGDAVVFFEEANIAHLGDLVFNRVYPFMDLKGGCSIQGSVTYLNEIIREYDNDTLFIFGHAASPETVTGNLSDVEHMRNYMEKLLKFVGAQIKAGKQPEEIYKAEYVPGFEDRKALWDGALKMNLEAAYKELSS